MRFSTWFPMFVVGMVIVALVIVGGFLFLERQSQCENEMMCSLEEFCAIQLGISDCPTWAGIFASNWPEAAASCSQFDPTWELYFMCVSAAVDEGQE